VPPSKQLFDALKSAHRWSSTLQRTLYPKGREDLHQSRKANPEGHDHYRTPSPSDRCDSALIPVHAIWSTLLHRAVSSHKTATSRSDKQDGVKIALTEERHQTFREVLKSDSSENSAWRTHRLIRQLVGASRRIRGSTRLKSRSTVCRLIPPAASLDRSFTLQIETINCYSVFFLGACFALESSSLASLLLCRLIF
jgi:hypothetical protein